VPLYAGTSGWAYGEWRGSFYPARLPQGQFLEHYGRRLTGCEVNSTFYRVQTAPTLARWTAAVPEGFRFAVKAHRRLTYRKQLAPDATVLQFVEEFLASLSGLGQKLGCVLIQVPEFIERDDAGLARLLDWLPPELRFACELQHASWEAPEIEQALAERGGTVCIRETEGRTPAALPPGPLAYVRLKGMHYPDQERTALIELLSREAARRDVFVFARHKDVPADEPHTGAGLAEWLAAKDSLRTRPASRAR
jgi:uncharacterized protein YecE (DUF72 family)